MAKEALISKAQRVFFLRDLWPGVCREMGWNAADRTLRISTLSEWLGREIRSLNEVGKLKEFDTVIAKARAISRPDDLTSQIRQEEQPTTRLIYSIQALRVPLAYRETIMRARFKTTRLEELTERQLTQLRDTLASRKSTHRKRQETSPSASGVDDNSTNPF